MSWQGLGVQFLENTGFADFPRGRADPVYNVNVVRQLCAEITAENDPQKAGELVSLLQAIFEENQEEIPVRMAFVADRKNGLMLHKTRFLLSGQFGYA